MANLELNVLLNDSAARAKLNSLANEAARFENTIKALSNRKITIQDNINETTQKILNLQNKLEGLVRERRTLKVGSDDYKRVGSEIQHIRDEIKNLSLSKAQLRIDSSKAESGLKKARTGLKEVNDEAKSTQSSLNSLASTGVSAGEAIANAFQTAGGVLQGIGGNMQSIGNLFGGKFVNTAKTMVSAFATMGLYSSAQGTVTRYDTMKMYPKQMDLLGFSATGAQKSVEKLEQSVIGLPTGLDEIVESARQLVTITGDLDKGTDLAIAANNALLAGGADTQQQTWGLRQIRDLLSAGTLRSQEWESLIKALGPGLKDIGVAMGQTDFGKFRTELKKNQVSAEDFLSALIKVGTGEGALAKRATLYKDTLTATARNIKNAVQRLGASGLDALDEVLSSKTGKNLPQTIVEISDAIKQNLTPALENWVSANGDKIVGFLDRLKNYDWQGLISKVGTGLAKYYDLMTTIFTKIPAGAIAKMAVWFGPVGKVVSGVGGFLSFIGRLVGVFAGANVASKVGEAVTAANSVGTLAQTVTSTSFLGGLSKFAKPVGFLGTSALLGGVIAEYAKVIEMISNLDIGPNFGKNMKSVAALLSASTVITGFITSAFAAFSEFAPAIAAGEGLTAGFVAIVGEVGGVIAKYVNIVGRIGSMKIPTSSKWDSMRGAIKNVALMLKDIPKLPGRKTKSMENLSESMEYMVGIAEGLKKINDIGNLGDQSDQIENILNSVNKVLEFDVDNTNHAKRIAEGLSNTSDSMESISEIATSLNEFWTTTKGWKKANIEALSNRASTMMTALTSKDGVFHSFQFKTKEYNLIKTNMDNLDKATVSLSTIATTIGQFWESTKGWKKADIEALGKRAGIMMTALTSKDGVLHAFQFKTKEYNRIKENMANLDEAVGSVANIAKNMRSIMRNIGELDMPSLATAGRGATPFDQMIRNAKHMVGSVVGIYDEIPEELDAGKAENAKALSGAIGYFPDIVESLAAIKKPVKNLGVKRDDWTLGKRLGQMVTNLSTAFSGLATVNYESLSGNAKALYEAIGYVQKMCNNLLQVQEVVNGNFNISGDSWDLGTKLGVIMSSLKMAFGTSADGTTGGLGDISAVASNLELIAAQLQAIANNAGGAAGALSNATGSLKKLGTAAKNKKQPISDVAKAIGTLKDNAGGIGGRATAAAFGVIALGSAAKSQVDNLTAAASAASDLASAINNIPSSKTVDVKVNGSSGSSGGGLIGKAFNAIGNLLHRANGGVVYRADGGTLFKPRGTDTVPAMLTPGEFVTRKKAVNYFGRDFMRRVNSLDVDGALRALSIRAGARVRGGYNVTNNYTRDNHATATFNIHRASQRYSQRVASRWMRSLV